MEGSIQCPICFERYGQVSNNGNSSVPSLRPRILPLCGHSLCESCLIRAITISLKDNAALFCHICKKEIPADILRQSTIRKKEDGLSLHGFPINWSLAELSEQHLKLKKQLISDRQGNSSVSRTSQPDVLNMSQEQRQLAATQAGGFRKSQDQAVRLTADSYIGGPAEGLKSMCFQCRGQNFDTHFCRVHLLKFCGGCALKHLQQNEGCASENILEIEAFDEYAQEVQQRGHLFQESLNKLEGELKEERNDLAQQIEDKIDSLIEMLAQTKRDVKQHYNLRQYILIQYKERVEKALSALGQIDTRDVHSMTLQKMRDSALRMNRLAELMSDGQRLISTEINVTNSLHFSSRNYQKMQLAIVDLIDKQDLEAFVGLGDETPTHSPAHRKMSQCHLRQRSLSAVRPHSADKDRKFRPGSQQEERAGSARVRFGSTVGPERRVSMPLSSPHIKNTLSSGAVVPRSQKSIQLHEISQEEESRADRDEEEEIHVKPFRIAGDAMLPRKELFGACSQGYVKSVQFLLDHFDFPGGINVRDSTGCTPFLRAAQAQQSKVYKMLVRKYYSDPNVQDNNGRTALIHACLTNDIELALFLVRECQVNTNLQTKWKDTALHFAVSHDNQAMVQLLVEEGGANLKIVNADLKRPKALAKSKEVRSILARATDA